MSQVPLQVSKLKDKTIRARARFMRTTRSGHANSCRANRVFILRRLVVRTGGTSRTALFFPSHHGSLVLLVWSIMERKMECDIANTAPANEHRLGKDPLTESQIESLAEFNAFFNHPDNEGAAMDAFSTPSSPGTAVEFPFSTSSYNDHLSTMLGSGVDPCSFGTSSYSDLAALQQKAEHPYYLNTSTFHTPSESHRHSLRRSVSEPPDGFGHHQITLSRQCVPAPPPMTFTRDGHSITNPARPARMGRSPYHKAQYRHQPYKGKPSPQHRHVQPSRYQIQRQGPGPTSAPHVHPALSPLHLQHHVFEPPPSLQGRNFVSSRVCTPVPSAEPAGVADETDSMLVAMDSPRMQEVASPGSPQDTENLTIPVSMNEFRTMIFEAVQKAMAGGQRESSEFGDAKQHDGGKDVVKKSVEEHGGKA